MGSRAVFLDRDGTLIEEVGYVNHVDRIRLYPWSAEAVQMLNHSGLKTIIVTNQAGIARGYFTEDLLDRVHEKLRAELARGGARLDAIYYCPHHPREGQPPWRQECECRKPKPGMLLRAATEMDLDLPASFVVGDRYGEVEMARSVGASSVFLLSGYGRGEYEYQRGQWPHPPDHVANDLLGAVRWILDQTGRLP
ncbi:MAG: HAD family hydrolase [Acidobacteria bacterium]|nr:HAD family hydrolase [Acidobacteriota bacterium]